MKYRPYPLIIAVVLTFSLAACGPKRVPVQPVFSTPADTHPEARIEQQPSQPPALPRDSMQPPSPSAGKSTPQRPRSIDIPTPATSPKGSAAAVSPPVQKSQRSVDGNYQVEVENMPPADFINLVFGEILKKGYTLDKSVEGRKETITLKMTQSVTAEELLRIVSLVLRSHGIEIEEKGGILFITSAKGTPQQEKGLVPFYFGSIPSTIEADRRVALIVPLTYIKPLNYMALIKGLAIGPGGQADLIPETNSIYIVDTAAHVQAAADLIKALDQPSLARVKMKLFYLDYIPVETFRIYVQELLSAQGVTVLPQPGGTRAVALIPLPEIRALLVASPSEEWFKLVSFWQERLDNSSILGDQPRYFIFYPQNRRASDLAALFGGEPSVARRSDRTRSRASTASAARTNTRSNERQISGALPLLGQPQPVSAAGLGQATPPGSQPLAAAGVSPQASPALVPLAQQQSAQVVVDEDRNALVILATPAEYQQIETLLTSLDVLPRQVLIEVTIAEVTLTDDLQYGIEWHLKHSGEFSGTLQTLGQLGLSRTTGFTYSLISDSQKFQALLQAYAQKNVVKLLSTPRLMVLDNREARINVGTEVPIVTSESTGANIQEAGTTELLRSVEYRNTGVILLIKPTINSGGMLTIDIEQEVSEAQTNTISDISSPLILTRSINTSVALRSGNSVLLGGLIRDNTSDTVNKVPLLGDVPVLGALFRTKSTGSDRTELVIQITPYILVTPEDSQIVTNKFKALLDILRKTEQ